MWHQLAPWIPLKVPAHGLQHWLWSTPICLFRNPVWTCLEDRMCFYNKLGKKKINYAEGESIEIFPEGIKRHYQNHSLLKPKSGNWTVFLTNPVMVTLGEISMLHGHWSSSGMRKQEIWIAIPMTYHSCVEAEKCWNYFELFLTCKKFSHDIPPENEPEFLHGDCFSQMWVLAAITNAFHRTYFNVGFVHLVWAALHIDIQLSWR